MLREKKIKDDKTRCAQEPSSLVNLGHRRHGTKQSTFKKQNPKIPNLRSGGGDVHMVGLWSLTLIS